MGLGEPDIPELKPKEEKERRGGAPPLLPLGGSVGGTLKPAIVKTGPLHTWLAQWSGIVSSPWTAAGLVAAIAVGVGLSGAIFGSGSLNNSQSHLASTGPVFRPSMRDAIADRSDALGAPGSLAVFQAANHGLGGIAGFQDETEESVETADEAAPAKSGEDDSLKKNVGIENNGFVPADAAAKKKKAWAKGKLALMKGFNNASSSSGGGIGGAGTRLNAPFNKKTGFRPRAMKLKKKLSDKKRKRQLRPVGNLRHKKGVSPRAMGQLKLARRLSNAAIGRASNSGSRSFAADAFDQRATIGDAEPFAPAGTGSSIGGIGVDPGGPLDIRDVGPSQNVTPFQNDVDNAQSETSNARILTIVGGILLGIGLALAAIGYRMMSNPFTLPQGQALLAIGLAMAATGGMMLIMGMMQANSAGNRGDRIAEESGQQDQGGVINGCADQALGEQECSNDFFQPTSSVQADVQAESESTFELQ